MLMSKGFEIFKFSVLYISVTIQHADQGINNVHILTKS